MYFLFYLFLIISIIGGPGSGKGTQSKYLSKITKIPHLSAGDLLRNAFILYFILQEIKKENELSETINEYISVFIYIQKGKILPSWITTSLIQNKILELQSNYLILDGFPRDIDNLKYWLKYYPQHPFYAVIYLNCSRKELYRRLSIRKIDSGRKDDNDEVINNRINNHFKTFAPIEIFFEKQGILHSIEVPDNVDVEIMYNKTRILIQSILKL